MTFATKHRPASRTPRHVGRAFTLIELLVVMGILLLLIGILLPVVNRAWNQAIRTRMQADFQAITIALDQYKNDWRSYPPVNTDNSGAATLCKALLGPYDEAHYYTGSPGSFAASNTLQNPPPAYDAGKTYQAGDVVSSGTSGPSYDNYVGGTQSSIFVCQRSDTVGKTPAVSPRTSPDFFWSLFLPYDGNDGVGGKERLGSVPDPTTEAPHKTAGKQLGAYLNESQFKTSSNNGVGMALLDRYGSPILYFPVNRNARPADVGGLLAYPTVTNTVAFQAVNVFDDLGPFYRDGAGEDATQPAARIGVVLGDYDHNAGLGTDEPPLPQLPFLLWSAGRDRAFGPRGLAVSGAASAQLGRQDFILNPGTPEDRQYNRQVAAAVDDVTNFRD